MNEMGPRCVRPRENWRAGLPSTPGQETSTRGQGLGSSLKPGRALFHSEGVLLQRVASFKRSAGSYTGPSENAACNERP